jgi:uncharacterized protein (DUF1697 family)
MFPVIAKIFLELERVVKSHPFPLENEKIVAFAFLNKISEIKEIEIRRLQGGKYKIDDDLIYLYCPSGFGSTKLTNNIIEKKLNVISTTRNLRTTLKLLQLVKA